MNKKLQVFISSTFIDLKEERQAAVEAILSAGHIPAGMELFNAGNDSQLITIKKWIDESDVYMLILGGRYGSIDPVQQLSYTEIEYRYALQKEMPVFAVFITDKALDAKLAILKKDAFEGTEPKKLKEFKELVLSKICRPFDDLKDIKIAVHETLNKFSREYKLSGWISGADVDDYDSLIKENLELNNRLIDLESKVKLTQVNDKEKNKFGKFSFSELEEILNGIVFNVPDRLKSIENAKSKYSLLEVFYEHYSILNIGVSHFSYLSDDHPENFLFLECAPVLLTFGLVEKDKKYKHERFQTSQLGLNFLAELEKQQLNRKKAKSKKDDAKS
jgi:hypothetical protein